MSDVSVSAEGSFEDSAHRLAQIVAELEGGDLPLERSLQLFEEGVRLARAAQERLDRAERRVEELMGFDGQGRPIVRELEGSPMRTAAALIIGNELLSGKIADANLVVLARTLRPLGIQLRRAVTILDEIDVIAREVRELSAAHDVLFTSGGVGPTHDDMTIEGVARAFDAGVAVSDDIERLLREYYGERVTEGHLLMARIPAGARLVTNGKVPWPTVVMRNVWVLPGVPEIFQMKMPLVRAELGGGAPFLSMAVFTSLDEGHIKALLDQVVADHREVEIGSYPKWNDPEYKTKLTFDGLAHDQVLAARDAFAAGLPEGALIRVE